MPCLYTSFFRSFLSTALVLPAAGAWAQAPAISAVAPAPNARAAARTGAVAITFSQPLTAASAAALKVFSNQRGGLRTRASTPATVSGAVLGFAPTTYAFAPGETVSLTVTTAAASSSGALARPRVSQFTVAAAGTGTGVYNGGSSVAAVTFPEQVLAGDVDGDGDLDLVTLNNTSGSGSRNGTASVRLNGGAGTFTGNQDVPVGIDPSEAALGDVDGDGDLDLLVVNYATGTVSVCLNNGAGTFTTSQTVGAGYNTSALALGDVDGDGDLDLLVTNVNALDVNNNTVNVRLNNGSGAFAGNQSVSVGSTSGAVRLGDVDNDGDLDLLAAHYGTASVSVRLNGGNATGSNTGLFSGGSEVAVGSRPYDLALGDVDGDGDLDLLSSSAEGTTVSVRLNGGTGTFGGGQTLAVGNNPRELALGDVDADGDLDLLVANTDDNTVSLRLNNGSGVFANGTELTAGTSPVGLALADLDADGDLDLLTTNYTVSGTVSVRLNRPTAAPTLSSLAPASGVVGTSVTLTGTGLSGVTSVSFNGTVQPVVSANTATSVTAVVPVGATTGPVTVTTAGGSGTSSTSFRVVPALSTIAPASGPAGSTITLTGTGLAGATSIAFAGSANATVSTDFVVNAAGTQLTGVVVPGGAVSGPVTVTTPSGTSNGVGFAVTVLAPQLTAISPASGPAGRTIALFGTGLTNASAITFAGSTGNVVTTGFSVPTAGSITGVVVPAGATTGSVTVTTPGGVSNGLPFTVTQELIITNIAPRANAPAGSRTGPLQITFNQPLPAASGSTLRVFGSQRGGLRTRRQPATVSGAQLSFAPTPAFLPGESVSYTISTLARPRVGSFVAATGGTGRGIFTGNQMLTTTSLPSSVATGDLDGDGDLDVVYGSQANVGVYLNGGDATGSNTGEFREGAIVETAAFPQVITLGDVDGDGDLDLLAASFSSASTFAGSSTVSVRLNGGDATGSNTGVFSRGADVPVGDGPSALALGDVDGDGDLDFVTANFGVGYGFYGTGNTVSVRLNNGSGGFSARQTVAVGTGAQGVALGDVDGDGDLDLLAANTTSGTVSVRLNGGDDTGSNAGTFSGGREVAVGPNPSSLALGDVDGDGDLDFVTVGKSAPGLASVRFNGGLGYFIGGTEASVAGGSTQVVLSDVDADGDLDLLTPDYGGPSVSVRLNGGDSAGAGKGFFSGGTNPGVASSNGSPAALALGDLDGDGDLDLLSANLYDRSVSVTLNRAPTEPLIANFTPRVGVAAVGGAVGTSVTLTGTHLGGATAVSFNGGVQTVITNNTATSLTVTVPAGATSGMLSVTTPQGLGVSTIPFSVVPTPVLTSISPARGPLGSTITLIGTGLQTVYGVVFAGTSNNTVYTGLVKNADGTQVTGIVVPSGAESGDLRAVATLVSSNSLPFTVIPNPLSLTQSGTAYPSGSLYDYGKRPIGAAASVTFVLANSGATPLVLSSVYATGNFALSGPAPTSVPAGGSVSVVVTFMPTTSGSVNGGLAFVSPGLSTYAIALLAEGVYPVPTISSVTPGSAAPGTTVTVVGTGFIAGATTLTLNGSPVPGVGVGAGGTSLTFSVPGAGTSGAVVVTTPGGSAAAPAPFCVQYTPIVYPPFSRCGPGTVTLLATGAPVGGTYVWYGSSTGGPALSRTQSFTTAELTATTGYYVAISTGAGSAACEGPRVPVTATVNALPVVSLAASGPVAFCQGGNVTLTASGAARYVWSTGQTTASITVSAAGTYAVRGTSSEGCPAAEASATVVVAPTPPRPVITLGSGGLLTSSNGTGNQWYLNGVALAGATAITYLPASIGSYTVIATSAAGCASLPSAPQSITVTATLPAALTSQLLLFPNPAQQTCTLQLPALAGVSAAEVRLVNALGQVVQHYATSLPARLTLDVRSLARGVYTVLVHTSAGTGVKRLVVE